MQKTLNWTSNVKEKIRGNIRHRKPSAEIQVRLCRRG
jgi:hypothetical protein